MSGGRWRVRGGIRTSVCVVVGLLALGASPVQRPLADLRVRSEATETLVEARIVPDTPVTDETSGPAAAQPGDGAGLISTGDTFAKEIRLALPDTPATQAASVIVGDPLVSQVRVLPREQGATLVIFVRQPVHYEIRRVSEGMLLRVTVRPVVSQPGPAAGPAVISGGPDEQEITLDAEVVEYERQGNMVYARGGVAVKRPGSTLTADEVWVNRSTLVGDARGDVFLDTEGGTVRGDHLEIDLEDEIGWVEQGEVELERAGYLITGDRIRKSYGQMYHVHDGDATTCRCGGLESPSWSIAARDLDVDLYGTARARHMTFRIKDVPVFYFPYGVFPVNRSRQSGFLIPSIGQSFGSADRGFEYEQPVYWAINKSADATAAFRVETAARMGGAAEYRYALDRYSGGTLMGTYFNEWLRSESDRTFDDENLAAADRRRIIEVPPRNRWGVHTKMRQLFDEDTRGYLNTTMVSDDLFFKEIEARTFEPEHRTGARNAFYTSSRLGGVKVWDRVNLWGEGTFYQDLNIATRNEDEGVFQRAPVIEFRARDAVLDDHVGLSFAGQAVNYQRDVGFDGGRLDMHPQVRVPFQAGRYLFGEIHGAGRGTFYRQSDRQEVAMFCVGGERDGFACSDQRDCNTADCETSPNGCGICGNVRQRFECVGGPLAGNSCGNDGECSDLACVGGSNDGELCRINPGRCGAGTCEIQTGICVESDRVDAGAARGTVEFGWRLGTEVSRVYGFERWGLAKVRHTIEPVVQYTWVPKISGQDALPLYDGVDRINKRNLFTYGIVSRLNAKSATQPADQMAPRIREVARLSVLQAYDLERAIAGNSHFSDVDFGLRLNPSSLLALNFEATYNFNDSNLNGTRVGVVLREPWWRPDNRQLAALQRASALSVNYTFVDSGVAVAQGVRREANAGLQEVNGNLYFRIGRFLGLLFHARLDLLHDVTLERGAGVRFISRCNCWMIDTGVVEYQVPQEDIVFRIQVTLSGLGSVGRGPGGSFLTPDLPRQVWP